jgi:UDP-N-acetylmuramoylalanine--D-glutamate ligase
MNLKDKEVVVVGLAKSGVAALELLKKQGTKARATEVSAKDSVACLAEKLRQRDFKIEIGKHTPDFLKGADLIITSPGVPDTALPIAWARKNNVKVIDEIELGFLFCKAPIIAVTGTNGKSTTVSLIGHIFNNSGRKAVVCGNIGNPFSGEIGRLKDDCVVVLEASSFQLSRIDKFRSKVAVLLNTTQNHLDRHANFNEYLAAKVNIFKNQSESDVAVLNYKDENIMQNTAGIKAKKVFFNKGKFDICDPKDLKIKGAHNVENAWAAALCAAAFGISRKEIAAALKSFEGLEHRCEYVATVNGVKFINDSKSTTVDAAIKALTCCDEPVVLIAGGRDKNSDFAPLRNFIANRVKTVVLIGEAREKIKNALSGVVDIKEADSMESAVKSALKLAKKGESVLLSPMCTSFDMFDDFEHRGRVFKEIVEELHRNA